MKQVVYGDLLARLIFGKILVERVFQFDFSLLDMFEGIFGTSGAGGAVAMILACLIALILAGCVAGFFSYLIGIPVLRLKSDYLAIATLGFAG